MNNTSFFVTPKVKAFSQEPLSFTKMLEAFHADPSSRHLRLGQYFYNRFLGSVQGDKRDFVDKLHAEQDYNKCKEMILILYNEYQWPLN